MTSIVRNTENGSAGAHPAAAAAGSQQAGRLSRRGVLLAAAAMGIALAPARGVAQGSAARTNLLTVALPNDPPTLDPTTNTNNVTSIITQNVFETLYTYDAAWNIVPMLADGAPTFADDGKRVGIRLRAGVKFHDGSTMSAADVVASLERFLKLSPRGGQSMARITDGVTATGPLAIEIRLKSPYAPLLQMLSFFSAAPAILPEAKAKGAMGGPLAAIGDYIGTGPYRLVERRADQYVRLERFADYSALSTAPSGYAGKRSALVNEVRFIPVPNANTRVQSVLSGQYLVADGLSTELYNEIKANPNVEPMVVDNGGWLLFVMNMRQGLGTNAGIRRAVQAALDPESMLLAGFGSPQFFKANSSIYPEGTVFHSREGAQLYAQKNPQRARQLLAQAGYRNEPFRILTGTQYDFIYKGALVAAENLRAAGMNVRVDVMDWAAVLEKRYDASVWDCFLTLHNFVPEPSLIATFNPGFAGWWDTEQKRAALGRFNSTFDPAQRAVAWNDLHRIMAEDAANLLIGTYFGLRAYNKRVEGVQPLLQAPFWNVSIKS
ncbi:MAG: ABC transporter substrate-binding protein [Alphaproteobacteria bacterium]|nr:ABC transporter substrate-binding protein [Alphaproteobacteria bacterium]